MTGGGWCCWYATDPDSLEVAQLAALTGISTLEALGYIGRLLGWAVRQATDGQTERWGVALDVALGWPGRPGELRQALVAAGVLSAEGAIVGWAERYRLGSQKERQARHRAAGKVVTSPTHHADAPVTEVVTSPTHHADAPVTEVVTSPTHHADAPVTLNRTQQDRTQQDSSSMRAGAREPERGTLPAGLEEAFIAGWATHCAGRGLLRPVLQISAIERRALVELGLEAEQLVEVLRRVGESRFLSGQTVKRFESRPRWVLEHVTEILEGRYDDHPETIRPELGEWLSGWSRGAGEAAEPPSRRTQSRDLALSALLGAWATDPATAPWLRPQAAEGAAKELRARVRDGRAKPAGLQALATRQGALEELLREGERRMHPVAAPLAGAVASIVTAVRPPQGPQSELARLRAKVELRIASAAERARLAEIERPVGADDDAESQPHAEAS